MLTVRNQNLANTTAAANARTGFGCRLVAGADTMHRPSLRGSNPSYLASKPGTGKQQPSPSEPVYPVGNSDGPAAVIWARLAVQRALCS